MSRKLFKWDSEEAFAAAVAESLRGDGWDLWFEVQFAGARADIVAVRHGAVMIVECKLCAGLVVLEQAVAWLGRANFIVVATPRQTRFFMTLCNRFGIGTMTENGVVTGGGFQRLRPGYKSIMTALCDEQRDTAPGNARADYHTPYRRTCQNLLAIVRQEPGITLRAAIERITHHYHTHATARASLRKWIDLGKVPGVTIRREGKNLTLHLEKP